MEILVSFCNVWTPGMPALVLLDPGLSQIRVVEPPAELQPNCGARGLLVTPDFLYMVQQEGRSRSPKLAVLDRDDLSVRGLHVFRTTGDTHSIWLSGDVLYVVSTGTDEVMALRLRGPEVVSEEVFWRPDPEGPRADLHHLNAVYGWRGELLVSGFGKKAGQRWSTALDGFIFNISRGLQIAGEIYHPHSLAAVGDSIAYCESGKRAVRVLGETRAQEGLPGYTRGLCIADSRLFVGTSVGRRVSKSTGLVNTTDPGTPAGKCGISRLALDTFEIEKSMDLSAFGSEIYDLLAVEGTDQWPIAPSNEPYSFSAMWRHQVDRAIQEITALVPPGETFILVDGNHWKTDPVVAGRRRLLFIEKDGEYWGPPPDEASALHELELLRQAGASFVVFGWTAFWWLDYYHRLRERLSSFPCLLENERVVLFDLRSGGGS